jgi:thiosulfate dehydrogenase
MTIRKWSITVICVTSAVYAGTLIAGMRLKSLSLFWSTPQPGVWASWKPPLESNIPHTPKGDSIRRGALLFNETPLYAPQFTQAKLSCTSCHAEGGIQLYASPMVGLPALFPMYNVRAGHLISLKDRIQECFVRSENGKPLDYEGPIMQSLVDYIDWLSQPEPGRRSYAGRGLVSLPDLKPDPINGARVYERQCAGCHGEHGEGIAPQFPPLWGPNSFNDGAGMHGIRKMAPFVAHNMPQNRMGSLSPQEAFDVSSFIHGQPRPSFNNEYKRF